VLGLDHGVEVPQQRIEREVAHRPVREAVPAQVETDERGELAQVLEEVPPDRALPVVLQVAQPAGDHHQRRPVSVAGVGDPNTVAAAREVDLLAVGRRSDSGRRGRDHGLIARRDVHGSERASTQHAAGLGRPLAPSTHAGVCVFVSRRPP